MKIIPAEVQNRDGNSKRAAQVKNIKAPLNKSFLWISVSV